MLKVGLTGGIACGKSHTLKQFQKAGAFAIDADKIVHRLLEPGQPGHKVVLETFGPDYFLPDSNVDRRKLGGLVFSNPDERQKLNQILHPLVFKEEQKLVRVAEASHRGAPVIIVDAALMVEAGSYRQYEAIVMLYCRPDVQLMRLINRDKMSADEALKRITSQMPLLEKIKYGDYIIENSGKLSNTNEQVQYTFKDLLFRYEENDFDGMAKAVGLD